MQSCYLQRQSCSSLHVSSDTHASTGTTTVLFLINAVKYKELSQPNNYEALFSLGKWWNVESKCCVGICWFTLPFRKKLSSLNCILCVLIKINYVALKSKIFWFNKHFFQQKVKSSGRFTNVWSCVDSELFYTVTAMAEIPVAVEIVLSKSQVM